MRPKECLDRSDESTAATALQSPEVLVETIVNIRKQ